MTLADWLIAAVLLLTVLSAARIGFFVEAFSLGGTVLGLVVASWNYQRLQPWTGRLIHSTAVAEAVSFLLIVACIALAAGLLGRGIRWTAHSIGLGWADHLLGGLFGAAKGLLLVTIAVLAIAAFFPRSGCLHGSRFAPYFLAAAHQAASIAPADLEQRVHEGVGALRNEEHWIKPASDLLEQETRAGYTALKNQKRGN